MVKSDKIWTRIKESGIGIERIANLAGMSRQALHNKLRGETRWTVSDIQGLCALLKLSEEDLLDFWFRSWTGTVTAGKQENRKTVTAGISETAMHAGKREP